MSTRPDQQLEAPGRLARLLEEPRVRKAFDAIAVVLGLYLVQQLLWPSPAGVVAQGVVVGATGSLLAIGLALVYRANRIVNFAQADLGLMPATLAVVLIQFRGWPFWPAAVAGVVVSLVVGALVQRLFIQRFFGAPRLILTVVTIGVSQILIAAAALLLQALSGSGGTFRNLGSMKPPIPWTFTIDPIIFRGFDVLAVLVVPFVIVGLVVLLKWTPIGVAMRASADSAERASLLGVPVARVQLFVWMAAAALSFIGVFLRAGSLGVNIITVPASGPLTMTRALGAAVIGRMENFGTILAASIGLGIVEQSIIWSTGRSLYALVADFVILMVALVFQRRRASGRVDDGEVSTWRAVAVDRPVPRELIRLPEIRWAAAIGKWGLVGVALAVPAFVSAGRTSVVALVYVYALLGLSLVVLTGWAGLVSLGQAGLFGVGGAVAAALTINHQWDMAVVLLLAGAVGAGVALVVGLPALRVRGMYLAVSTMAFSVLASSYLINRETLHWVPSATDFVSRPMLGRIDLAGERAFYYVCLASLAIGIWMVRGLRGSRTGRVLIGMRDNERGVQAFGANVVRAKLTAFAVSGFLAAVAGALYVHSQQALGATRFDPGESLRVFTMVVIGGMGSIPGAIIGSVYLNGTQWFIDVLPIGNALKTVILFAGTGVGVIFILLALPGGLGSVAYALRDRFLRAVARRRDIIVPSLVADRSTESLSAPRPSPEPGAGAEPALLRVRDLEVGYDGVQVLFGVDLEVKQGEIVALLGTNGAGKSTLLRAISGLTPPTGGTIELDGESLLRREPHVIAASGVAHVPGGRGVFPSLSVAENLRIAGWMHRRDTGRVARSTQEVLDRFPVLREKLALAAGDLSGGQQQMLTLAQSFMTGPRLIMIDELSLGLAPVVVEELIEAVKRMRDDGVTVVLVEQSVNVALTVADHAYFLEKGEVRFRGDARELLDRPDILRSVFVHGAAAAAADGAPARATATVARAPTTGADAPVALRVEGLARAFGGVLAVDDVSFTLHEGEILGIIGPNGAGKTTVFDLISGFTAPDRGRVILGAEDVTALGPDVRARMGLGRSFQDARLFPGLTVAETIAVAFEERLEVRDPLAAMLHLPAVATSELEVALAVDELIELLGLGAFRDKFVAELSTGSRRIVDLACTLAQRPRVLLFDEPSSGIAQRETEALGPLLLRIQRETGASILVIEHDMALIASVSDELVAMHLGQVLLRSSPAEVLRDPRVIETYLGTSDEVIGRSSDRRPGRRVPRARKLVAAGR